MILISTHTFGTHRKNNSNPHYSPCKIQDTTSILLMNFGIVAVTVRGTALTLNRSRLSMLTIAVRRVCLPLSIMGYKYILIIHGHAQVKILKFQHSNKSNTNPVSHASTC